MNKAFLLFIFCSGMTSEVCLAQAGMWTWMKGDTAFKDWYYAPVKGVEDISYHPPSIYLANSWSDDSGKFWLFGGVTYSSVDGHEQHFDKIWRYNPTNNSWAYIKGSQYLNSFGEYGTQGVPNINNHPGGRKGAGLWKNHDGSIWLFGGNSIWGFFNDMWKYNMSTNEWTWIKGPDTWDVPGVYGTKGVPANNNNPPPRREAATWVDNNNNLWMLGGFQETNYQLSNFFNDLWKYDIVSNQWTWEGGRNTTDDSGFYGIQGIPDTANLPPSRSCNCSWSDNDGNFYLYGGSTNFYQSVYMVGDVWRYNIFTKEWTWLKGSDQENVPGVQGDFCEIDSQNYPISRMESSCIKLDSDKILMFGGFLKWAFGYASCTRDVWIYNFKENIWNRTWGDSLLVDGHYGVQGIYDPSNDPRSRYGAVSWLNGKDFWVYGGNRCVDDCSEADLWKYTIDSNCLLGVYNSIEPSANSLHQILIYPNPSSGSFMVEFSLAEVSENRFLEINVVNTLGQKVFSANWFAGPLSEKKQIDLTNLPGGFYFIELSTGLHSENAENIFIRKKIVID